MNATPTMTLADLGREHPQAIKVFERHGLEFCCGGQQPLQAACAEQGLDPDAVLSEIAREEQAALARGAPVERWDERPVEELIDHIVSAYHRPLDEELPRLAALAEKVAQRHGARSPMLLPALRDVYQELRADLTAHMRKEEEILFPMLRAGRFAGPPMHVMRMEHETAGALLQRMRSLTSDYAVPEDACRSWGALYEGLEALERDLHAHIHLENNVLFPRVGG